MPSANSIDPPNHRNGNENQALLPASAYADVPSYPAYPVSAPSGGSALQLQRYLAFLSKKWWIPLVSILFCGGLATAYVLFWPTSYVSTAHMWLAGKYRLRESATYDDQGQNFLATQVELLTSAKIQTRAFARLQEVMHLAVPTNSEGPLPVKLKVAPVQKSGLLELKATGPGEAYVRAFLDATMDEFIAFKREVRAATAGLTYNSVSEQITRQEAELKTEQEKLNTYMRENNVAALEEQSKAAGAYLMQLTTELSRLNMERQILEATTTNGTAAALGAKLLPGADAPGQATDSATGVKTAPSDLQAGRQELEKLRITRARLSNYLRSKHPKIIKLDEQIAQAEKLVEYFGQQNREQLAAAGKDLDIRIDRVQQNITNWETKVNQASERLATYQGLKDNVAGVESMHQRLLSLLQNVDLSRNLEQEQIEVLDQASPAKPAKFAPPVVALLAIVLGAACGLGVVFLVERVDDRVTSLEDLTQRFQEWVVGQVPEVNIRKKECRPPLVESGDSRHVFAESHRSLRSALFFANFNGEKPKTLLVTSAIPNEGKSTVAANLARTLAFAGGRVLLVDADMRRGVLHRLFETPQEPGLSDLLLNGGDMANLVVPTAVPNLFLLPRGATTQSSGELLLSNKCDRLFAQMRQEYDCVIVDSIPIFAADDTTSLAPKMDGVLFVIRGSFTGSRTARRALELLYERQAKVLGLVVNRVNAASRSYDYYKYAQYYGAEKSGS